MSSNVAKKLVLAMQEMNGLAKEGKNDFHKYKYIRDTELVNSARRAFVKAGLAFIVSMDSSDTVIVEKKDGKTARYTVVHLTVRFICTESGESIDVKWQGEAIDDADKSINKAVVAGTKYVLLRTLLQAEADEEDADNHSPEVNHQQRTAGVWTQQEAAEFYRHWVAQALTQADILQALGVKQLGDWKQSAKAANDAVKGYIEHITGAQS